MPVLKASESRWKQAQEWELDVWRRENGRAGSWVRRMVRRLKRRLSGGDDWNHWWKAHFDDYTLIPDTLEHAIELGCGPYTNMRLILPGRQVRRVYCSDPLALEYVHLDGWLAQAYRRGQVLLDNHPAEECPFASNLFDLVVMINVLDHVYDVPACLQQVMRITRPGGLLVLGQDLTSPEEDLDDNQDVDIGHPIRFTHHELDQALGGQFEPLLYRVLDRAAGRNPAAHYGTYIYIGKKNPVSQG